MKTKQINWLAALAVWLALAFGTHAAEQTNKVAIGGQEIIITATNSLTVDDAEHKITWHGHVRVTDREMELMCELLTVYFQTNAGSRQIDRIVAETNVVIAQKDSWAFGDLAVYTATNDVVVLSALSGEVLLDNPELYLIAPKVIYDRATGKLHAPGSIILGAAQNSNLSTNFGISLPRPTPRQTPKLTPPPDAPPRTGTP